MCGVWALSSSPSSQGVGAIHYSKETSLNSVLDTPWDEPTTRSPEFCRYVSGEILREDPWNRLGQNALCMFAAARHYLY